MEMTNAFADSKLNTELKRKKKRGGFTLIELIVVIAIVGIMVGLSALAYSSVVRRYATRAAKLIDSEISTLASNTYSKEGDWRLQFKYDSDEGCYCMMQQRKIDTSWETVSTKYLNNVEVSFGNNYSYGTSTKIMRMYRETGMFYTGSYLYTDIYVRAAGNEVRIQVTQEGGHNVV